MLIKFLKESKLNLLCNDENNISSIVKMSDNNQGVILGSYIYSNEVDLLFSERVGFSADKTMKVSDVYLIELKNEKLGKMISNNLLLVDPKNLRVLIGFIRLFGRACIDNAEIITNACEESMIKLLGRPVINIVNG